MTSSTEGNGLIEGAPAVRLGRRVLARVQLVPDGAFYAFRNPTALQTVELARLADLPLLDQVAGLLPLLCRLLPDAPEAEVRDLDMDGVYRAVALASDPVKAMEEYAARELADPNATGGPTTTSASVPAMSLATSAPPSPAPPGATSGAS